MKIDCNVIKDLLVLYVDGDLSEESKTLVEEHLVGCNDCREYLDSLREADFISESPAGITAIEQKSIEQKADFEKIRFKVLKQLMPSLICIGIVIIMLSVAANEFLFERPVYIPYDEGVVTFDDEGKFELGNLYDIYVCANYPENREEKKIYFIVRTDNYMKLKFGNSDGTAIYSLEDLKDEEDDPNAIYEFYYMDDLDDSEGHLVWVG